MCGIVGYFSQTVPINPKTFDRMRDTLATRGPDGASSKYFSNNRVALGHRRLSIIDLSDHGTQPMSNEDGNVWLTFNGEIYNHPQLSRELISLGHKYQSSCDAETIIHAWEEWGNDCVRRFRGIFAFTIWDMKSGDVFCARDHLGVKPFYYADLPDALLVASLPRAFLAMDKFAPKVEEASFADYLFYGIVPHDKSVFKNVKKLPPGHCLTYRNGKIEISSYWQLQYQADIVDFEEAKQEISKTLVEAVSLQLMSDVPYGTYLSGGIDSSLITSIATHLSGRCIPSITVGFKQEKFNEVPYAKRVAEHCGAKLQVEMLGYSTAMNLVQDLIEAHDEPYALGAGIPLMFIAKCTQQQQLKVILAGDGADELFAGYHHYDQMADTKNTYQAYQPHEAMVHDQKDLRMLGSALKEAITNGPEWRYNRFVGTTGNSVLDAQLLDSQTYLPDEILMKVDRASMAYGVEVRVPFLDQQLVELVFRIDHKLIYRAGDRKALLKAVAKKWLPKSVLTQRKKGFSAPIRRWSLHPSNWLRMYFTIRNGALADLNLINADEFSLKGLALPPEWMWKYYIAELWARRWIAS